MAFPKLLSKLFTNSGAGSKLNPGLASSLPIGAITAFSGNFDSAGHPISSGTADTSWRLCDGGDGTPDLRGRFVLGVSDGHSAGQTGGEEAHTLNWNEMPEHNHGATISNNGNHYHLVSRNADIGSVGVKDDGTGYDSVGNYNGQYDKTTNWAGDHTHEISIANAGASWAHNNMPPYYALSFIMKIA